MTERAKQATGELRQQAGEVGDDLRSQARHLVTRTRDEATKEASERTSQLAGTLHGFAEELRAMAQADQGGRLVGIAEGAAERADRAAARLDERGIDGLVADIKRGVRRRPGLVLAAALASGFVVGRLVREGAQVAAHDAHNGQRRPGQGGVSDENYVALSGASAPDLVADEHASTERGAGTRTEGNLRG
jgi:hypothetical protein